MRPCNDAAEDQEDGTRIAWRMGYASPLACGCYWSPFSYLILCASGVEYVTTLSKKNWFNSQLFLYTTGSPPNDVRSGVGWSPTHSTRRRRRRRRRGREGGGALAAFRNVRLSGRARQRQRAVQRQAGPGRSVGQSVHPSEGSARTRKVPQCNATAVNVMCARCCQMLCSFKL